MQKEQIEEELHKANQIFNEAVTAFAEAVTSLTSTHNQLFPNNPVMLPTLYMSAMCCCIKDCLDCFPQDVQYALTTMIARNLGLEIKNNDLNLADMPVLGNA